MQSQIPALGPQERDALLANRCLVRTSRPDNVLLRVGERAKLHGAFIGKKKQASNSDQLGASAPYPGSTEKRGMWPNPRSSLHSVGFYLHHNLRLRTAMRLQETLLFPTIV